MPNTKENVLSLPGKGDTSLSHETAEISTSLSFSIKGSVLEKQLQLASIMQSQALFMIKCIEDDTATSDNKELATAIMIFLEARHKSNSI